MVLNYRINWYCLGQTYAVSLGTKGPDHAKRLTCHSVPLKSLRNNHGVCKLSRACQSKRGRTFPRVLIKKKIVSVEMNPWGMTGKQSLGAFRRESVLQRPGPGHQSSGAELDFRWAAGTRPEAGRGWGGRASRAGPGLWWSPEPRLPFARIKRLPGTVESSRCMTESWFTTSEAPADSRRTRSQMFL